MSGSIVPVATGTSPTQISGSNLNDTTIYNMSTTSAVWISNSASVAPNSGMRIGPLGTAKWSKASGLAYACVDTGVVNPINLNISNDISDPANPVDVATATALALLAQGIPNVLVTKTLLNTLMHSGNQQVVDVSGQASLVLQASTNSFASVVLLCQFTDPNSAYSEAFYLTIPNNTNAVVGQWEIPVVGPTFTVILIAGNPDTTVTVMGTNRGVPNLRQRDNSYLPRRFQSTTAFVLGTPFTLTPIDGIADTVTRFNGPVKLSWEGNAAAVAAGWTPQVVYANPLSVGAGGLPYDRTGANITVNNTVVDWYHPPVPVLWQGIPTAAAAAPSVILTVTPAGSGL